MFMGFNGFVWWQGVVENRYDPLKLGRCQVRIVGVDSEQKYTDINRGIETKDLRWAHPMMPINSASMNGIGHSPTGPVEGTWVFGFFRDGESAQDAVMIGTVGGIPSEKPDTRLGFCDPSGTYPKDSHIGEPDTNRLARGVSGGTCMDAKNSGLEAGVSTAGFKGDGSTWSEPASPYAAVYPHNHVYESESGHVKEYDDTPGAERIHEFHKSGTFTEIHPDGTKVVKVVGDDYEIVIGNKTALIKGNISITVDGDAQLYVKGNSVTQIDGNANLHVKQNVDAKVNGTTTIDSDGHVEVKCPTANIGHQSIQSAVLGEDLKAQIDHLIEVFNNHEHFGNLGVPTSTPTVLGHIQQWHECRSATVNIRGPLK